jgi:hypothetical protein|tara:strand:- start:29 stop:607 length:579 start_codon:yes stop_codon:yes gene_type:complete
MTKLCPRGKAAAKRKFKVYPSAYANAYASKICAGKIKDPSGVKRKDFKGPKPVREGDMIKIEEERQKRKSDKFRRLGQSYFDTKMLEKLRKNQGRRAGTKAQKKRGFDTQMEAVPNFRVKGAGAMSDMEFRKSNEAIKSRALNTSDVKKLMDAMPNFKVGGHNVMGSPISVNVDGDTLNNPSASAYYKDLLK